MMVVNVSKLINRGEKLDDAINKSENLVNEAKQFEFNSKWNNYGIFRKLFYYINPFNYCCGY